MGWVLKAWDEQQPLLGWVLEASHEQQLPLGKVLEALSHAGSYFLQEKNKHL